MAVWHPKKRIVATLLCAGVAATGFITAFAPLPVSAQTTVAAPSSAASSRPDVQVLVLVLPTGTTAVSSVYPGQVPKAVAQGRVDRLLKLTGWKARNRKFSDAPAPPNLFQEENKKKLSAASFETESPVMGSDGTIDWEPFLRAFGDLKRVNVLFLTETPYAGPTQFDSEQVSLTVVPQKGNILAAASIKTPGKELAPLTVPKSATANSVQEKPVAAANSGSGRRTVGIALAVTFAALFAFFIYKLTSNYAVRR